MNRYNVLQILSTLFFVVSLTITTSDANAYVSNTSIITLAGIEGYKPFSYTENNNIVGLYNDIIEELFSRTKYKPRIQLMPFKRLISNAKDGSVDGVIGVFSTPEREKFSTYIKATPLTKITSYIFVLKKSNIKSSSLNDISKKVIAHKRGFIISSLMHNAAKNNIFQTQEVETTEQLVGMLLANRVDGFVQEKANALYYIAKYDKNNSIKLLEPPVSAKRLAYLAFSKKALTSLPENFIETISLAFESMVADGTFEKINAKYNIVF